VQPGSSAAAEANNELSTAMSGLLIGARTPASHATNSGSDERKTHDAHGNAVPPPPPPPAPLSRQRSAVVLAYDHVVMEQVLAIKEVASALKVRLRARL